MTTLILVGAGHAHAQVLLEFGRRRPERLSKLILVAPQIMAPYSGMVPGWMAGHYSWDECCIDFERLCRHAGAEIVQEDATGIDADASSLVLASGVRLQYDWLSLNIGATLKPAAKDSMVLALRPLSELEDKWADMLETVKAIPPERRFHLLMVGGGPAGVETVLAARHAISHAAPKLRAEFTLATSGDQLVPGLSDAAARRLRAALDRAAVSVVNDFKAVSVESNIVLAEDGRTLAADAVLWATGAQPYRWPAESGLAADERGFIHVGATLQSVSHPNVFAVGDCAGWEQPLPKAGVFAVRMGPVLARNLDAAIDGGSFQDYVPQSRYLVLIGTGERHAVGTRGKLAWQGKWAWHWKEYIDRRFIAAYNGKQGRAHQNARQNPFNSGDAST